MDSRNVGDAESGSFDFRGIHWGASHEEVLASEPHEPNANMPGSMVFRATCYGLPMLVTYSFANIDGELVCFGAAITNDPAKNNFYSKLQTFAKPASRVQEAVDDYQAMKEGMKQHLGEPVVDDAPYEDQELVEALRDHASRETVELEQLRELSGDPSSSLVPSAQELAHTKEELEALMVCTAWQSETTDIKLYLEPTAFGGAMLIARFMSRELADQVMPG